MKRNSTRTIREPSKASLREIPEVDFSKARVIGRGRLAERVRRSLEPLLLDRKIVKTLGGPEAVARILAALAEGVQAGRKKRPAA